MGFECILAVRDNFGKDTGKRKYYAAETGVAIHDFWIKNTPHIRRKKKKSPTDSKNSKKENRKRDIY